jgi:hypothetical protein
MAKHKPQGYEYRLRVLLRYDDREQVTQTHIRLETAASFASFRYEISVQETRLDRGLKLKILGLKAPQLSLPSSGPAAFIREYTNLKGVNDLVVEGLDDKQSVFTVDITPNRVLLVKRPRESPIEIIVDDNRPPSTDIPS